MSDRDCDCGEGNLAYCRASKCPKSSAPVRTTHKSTIRDSEDKEYWEKHYRERTAYTNLVGVAASFSLGDLDKEGE